MTTYHLMVEEDVPVCGSHDSALTYRLDVADCPKCFRIALTTAQAEVERTRSEKYEAACLRTGHVATEAVGKIAALEAELAAALTEVERLTGTLATESAERERVRALGIAAPRRMR